jgi:hypothetical protein
VKSQEFPKAASRHITGFLKANGNSTKKSEKNVYTSNFENPLILVLAAFLTSSVTAVASF